MTSPRSMTVRLFAIALALLACACSSTRRVMDPVVEIRSDNGRELGVATDHGVIFLGRTVQMGEIEVIAWYGDGPSIEVAVVEPIGGGLFTAEPEIRVPTVQLSFRVPKSGQEVLLVGRRGRDTWEDTATVQTDSRVRGILLSASRSLAERADQVGAGVYYVDEHTEERKLVGLVSGVLTLTDGDGSERSFLTVVGPEDLWRLVTYRRDLPHKPRWVYREDIL